ncbi:uncharacterized protein KY384_004722 [Bacidia gigantensis]|uniref:uncharacterized protein n=1 Tax=Bacidia gigantensis TaxID=2732470 RepID=UPI001D054FC2|nr:uncharacterized protein KY384_004722 [Bacidia gigantensis]KAG8530222.1 hypothetical protein KY384_004722 [Bacidia gigantensis]
MDKLPPEVLQMIIANVSYRPEPHDDDFAFQYFLGSLRLVNRAFADATIPSLFSTIPLWIGSKSLQNLTAISEHPVISKYVKVIHFSNLQPEIFNLQISKDHTLPIETRIKAEALNNDIDLAPTDLDFQQYFASRARWVENETRLSRSDEAKKVLIKAFGRLNNLRDFSIVLQSPWIGAKEVNQAFKEIEISDITFSASRPLEIALEALDQPWTQLTSFQIMKPKIMCEDNRRNINCPGNRYFLMEDFSGPTPATIANGLNIFKPSLRNWSALQSLSVHLVDDSNPFSDYEIDLESVDTNARELKGLLRSAPNLRVLHLILDAIIPRTKPVYQYIAPGSIPELRHLLLEGIDFHCENEMLDFFESRYKQLGSVRFNYVQCLDGSGTGTVPMRPIVEHMMQWDWETLQSFVLGVESDITSLLKGGTDEDVALKPEYFWDW